MINIVWQTILLRDLDILRCSKGNVSLADCRNAVLLFSRPNDVLTQVHLFQQKKRCWDRQGGTWQAQLQPRGRGKSPRSPRMPPPPAEETAPLRVRHKVQDFDGRRTHYVEPWVGSRTSVPTRSLVSIVRASVVVSSRRRSWRTLSC